MAPHLSCKNPERVQRPKDTLILSHTHTYSRARTHQLPSPKKHNNKTKSAFYRGHASRGISLAANTNRKKIDLHVYSLLSSDWTRERERERERGVGVMSNSPKIFETFCIVPFKYAYFWTFCALWSTGDRFAYATVLAHCHVRSHVPCHMLITDVVSRACAHMTLHQWRRLGPGRSVTAAADRSELGKHCFFLWQNTTWSALSMSKAAVSAGMT